MPSRSARFFALAIATVVSAAALEAHDTWLRAALSAVRVGAGVTLDMTSGSNFDASHLTIAPARVAQSGFRLAGSAYALRTGTAGAHALRLRASMPAAGIAMFWVTLHPRVLTLEPRLVKEYVDEIGAPPEFYADWQKAPDKTWRERYSKHAKTFVRVGADPADSSWAVRVGQPYELVPMQNPTALAAGDSLSVLVLRCGQPLPNVSVGVQAAGATHGAIVATNAAGVARVGFDRAGRWLIRSTYLNYANRVGALCERPLPRDTVTVGYVSQFATMTLDLAPRRP